MFLVFMLLFSNSVMANEVVLKPGGQVLVRAGQDMQVSCSGASTHPSRCLVLNGQSSAYLVLVGNSTLREHADSLDEALDLVERLRKAGLCQ